jgi:hypothetical protein
MANAIKHGAINTAAVQQPTKYSYRPRQGRTRTESWRGTSSQIDALYSYYANLGWEVDVQQRGAADLWDLSATLTFDFTETPPTVWEISGHASEQSVLECTDRTPISTLTTNQKLAIELSIKEGNEKAMIATITGDTGQDVYPKMKTVYNLMAIGVEGKQVFNPTVRRTITVSNNYNANWSLNNVGKVLSKGTLLSSYGVPNYISNLMANSSTEATDNNGVKSVTGYLEQYPNYQTVGGNNIQISQEWIYSKFSTLLYDFI